MRALFCLVLVACGGAQAPQIDPKTAVAEINETVDAWHAAAARADENAYFALLSEDAVFLGTDATERWNKQAFRKYAHPHFKKGKAWSFRAARRDVMLSK